MNSFKVSYVTTFPKEGNAPRVTITGSDLQKYIAYFYELRTDGFHLVSSGALSTNQTILAKTKQWFTIWGIRVVDESNLTVFTDVFSPTGETIFIKIDSFALGDTIAWIPYIDEFRKKYKCNVICSSFHNNILSDVYPDIMFVQPNTVIHNVYAQYYIGASNDDNPYYSPIKVNNNPLQDVASRILGLDQTELRPDLSCNVSHIPRTISEKYVTLSEFGSAENKSWRLENGWQGVVDYLNSRGYKVLVISKEKTKLTNVIDKTGDTPLKDRMIDMFHADFHLGVSSGLSWLAWGLGKQVVMISDVTPKFHEFQTDNIRLNSNELSEVNYLSDRVISLQEVIAKLEETGVS